MQIYRLHYKNGVSKNVSSGVLEFICKIYSFISINVYIDCKT